MSAPGRRGGGIPGRTAGVRAGTGLLLLAVAAGPVAASAPRASGPGSAGLRAPASSLHTALEGSFPRAGATVEAGVTEIRLRFTTPVQVLLSTIALSSSAGPVETGAEVEAVPGSGGREIRLGLGRALPPGSYSVRWRTAGPDSHPISGELAFRIGAPGARQADRAMAATTQEVPTQEAQPGQEAAPAAGDTAAAPPGAPAGPTLPGTAVRWLFFVSIVLMVGSVSFRGLVLPQLRRREGLAVAVPRTVRSTWVLAWVAAGLGLLALPARLWHQSVLLFGGDALGATNLSDLLFRSVWGRAWFAEAVLAVLFVAGAVWAAPDGTRKRGWAAMTLAAVGICGVPAVSGHAWGVEELQRVAVASHGVHVLAAGVWMGSLGALLFAGLPAFRAIGGREALPGLLPGLVNAFSRVAIVAVGLLVASGVLNAWIHLDGIGQLVSTDYGRSLLLKLGAAAAAMTLGFYNWRVVRPSLESDPRTGLLRIPATVEFLIGLGVLALTALLVARGLPG